MNDLRGFPFLSLIGQFFYWKCLLLSGTFRNNFCVQHIPKRPHLFLISHFWVGSWVGIGCYLWLLVSLDCLTQLPGKPSSCNYVVLDWPIPWTSGICPPQAPTHFYGARFITLHLRHSFGGISMAAWGIFVPWPCAWTHLNHCLVLYLHVSGALNKYLYQRQSNKNMPTAYWPYE